MGVYNRMEVEIIFSGIEKQKNKLLITKYVSEYVYLI